MPASTKQITKEVDRITMQRNELADSHCHLDLMENAVQIGDSITYGVHTIITNGVDTKSNARTLEMSDNVSIFPALGIDPEHVPNLKKGELDFNLGMIRQNRQRVVAIGEIGLDYLVAKTEAQRNEQKRVFGSMLDLANELDLPVSVHSRESMEDVLSMLGDRSVRRVHLHFFSGSEKDAREAGRRGYMISVPPAMSSARRKAVKAMDLRQIMAETDCPIVGKSPKDVEKSVREIASIRALTYEETCRTITDNTKRFFSIEGKFNKPKTPLIRY